MASGGEAWVIVVASALNGVAVLIVTEFARRQAARRKQPGIERDAVLASAERAVTVLRNVMEAALKEQDRELRDLRQRVNILTSENKGLRQSFDEAQADILELRGQLRDVRNNMNGELT